MNSPLSSWISPKFQSRHDVARNAKMYHSDLLSRRLPTTQVLCATPEHILVFCSAQEKLVFQIASAQKAPKILSFPRPSTVPSSFRPGWGVIGDGGFIAGSVDQHHEQSVVAYSHKTKELATASGRLYTAFDGDNITDVIIQTATSLTTTSSQIISFNAFTGHLSSSPQAFIGDMVPMIFNRPCMVVDDYVPYDVCLSTDFRRIFFDHYFANRIAHQLWTVPCMPIKDAVEDFLRQQRLADANLIRILGIEIVGLSDFWKSFDTTVQKFASQMFKVTEPAKAWRLLWHQPETYSFLKPLIDTADFVPTLNQLTTASSATASLL